MCGIAGIISPDHNNVSEERLQKMTDSIKHRGPESEGLWMNEKSTVGFGHRRLSIIDLSEAGAQPMHYAGRYTITFNGEIYNYVEIREVLLKKGYAFNSNCDTEVILAAYHYYGTECLQHFDGMFAFAIWDEKDQKLFCARDRFGEKPFYYCEDNNHFVFASEMKALWAAGVPKTIDDTMLLNYVTIGYTCDPVNTSKTFYKNIFNLQAGHYVQLNLNASGYDYELVCYWDIDKETQTNTTEKAAIEKFAHLFQTSVKRRLRSDVQVGTSLSGGLDSSSIVATIHQLLLPQHNYHLASFSAIFPGFEKDESQQVKLITDKYKLKNYTLTPTSDGLINDFEKLIYHQEEPFQSSSIYAQYKVYELAKQHGVTVLLDGQGADEILAGYHQYYYWYWQELIAKSKFRMQTVERSKTGVPGKEVSWGIKNYFAAFLPSYTASHLEKKVYQRQAQHPHIASEFLLQNQHRISVFKPVVRKLNDILYYNTMQCGLGELLRYADRNSMAHSREVRLPFLSHELVQFIFSLPSHFKVKEGYTKWILRNAMQTKLPEKIVWRKEKTGFEPPQQKWMQNKNLQEYIHESKRVLAGYGLLNSSALDAPVKEQAAHEANNFDWRYLCAAKCL